MIRTKFWGVRGSIPAPGTATAGIGGNTSCVEMRCGSARLIFDAGTGIRLLGRELASESPCVLHLFFSHVHWDHIQGFPFFAPAFIPGTTIHLHGPRNYLGTIETVLGGQMEFPTCPVVLDELAADLVFHDVTAGDEIEISPGLKVRSAAGHHPGGVLAYRVDYEGSSVVYATDTEYGPDDLDPTFVELCRGADLLIYDTMYTPEEYDGRADGRSRAGWGHSTWEGGVALAKAAGVKRYALFHHDPDQDDAAVERKLQRTKELFPNCLLAREGLELEIRALVGRSR